MNRIIMICMAAGALLGGLDRIFGNRFGLGEKFEEGFRLMGPIGLSMAGIICLAPVLANLLGRLIAPAFSALGFDPAIFGSVLAIDMGGYQLAMQLAADPQVGRFAGIIAAATFGCTVVYTIPVGMGTVPEADRPLFAKGILIGLIAMPAALLTGGLLSGLGLWQTLFQCLPIFLVSALLLIGILKCTDRMIRGFTGFARVIRIVTTAGLALGAVQYLTGWTLLPGLAPLEDAMAVVCAIAIVLLGCLPLAALVMLLLKRPLAWLSRKTGLNPASTTGLLVGAVNITPAIVMIGDMDPRGKVINAAALVCSASAFSAHLAFTFSTEADLVPPLLAAKLLGGALAAAAALFATRHMAASPAK